MEEAFSLGQLSLSFAHIYSLDFCKDDIIHLVTLLHALYTCTRETFECGSN